LELEPCTAPEPVQGKEDQDDAREAAREERREPGAGAGEDEDDAREQRGVERGRGGEDEDVGHGASGQRVRRQGERPRDMRQIPRAIQPQVMTLSTAVSSRVWRCIVRALRSVGLPSSPGSHDAGAGRRA
jgi:hypothetical protein